MAKKTRRVLRRWARMCRRLPLGRGQVGAVAVAGVYFSACIVVLLAVVATHLP